MKCIFIKMSWLNKKKADNNNTSLFVFLRKNIVILIQSLLPPCGLGTSTRKRPGEYRHLWRFSAQIGTLVRDSQCAVGIL
jgi:hypothetical protein